MNPHAILSAKLNSLDLRERVGEAVPAVASVYSGEDYNTLVLAALSIKDSCFIVQYENVKHVASGDRDMLMVVVYNNEGQYVGNLDQLQMLITRGITSQVQPAKTGITCCIGFNEAQQTWYGWSHRAIYGFTIGSTVQRGDCAYVPTDKADAEAVLRAFWEDGSDRFDEESQCTFTTIVTEVKHDVSFDGMLGMEYSYNTECSEPSRSFETSGSFWPYPNPFGRGEWTAVTLDDAKQMALEYADNVG